MATTEFEILRRATTNEEFEQLKRLVLDSIESSPWEGEKISYPAVTHTIQYFLSSADADKKIVIIARKDKEIVGVIGGLLVQQPIMGVSTASEMMWYVKPSHRKTGVAKTLLDMFEDWANRIDAQYVVLAHYSNPLGESVKELYKRKGFKPMEVTYIKELT